VSGQRCRISRACSLATKVAVLPPIGDLPDGKCLRFIGNRVKPSGQKYSASVFQKYVVSFPPSRAPQEGRIAIVTDVECGMRWTSGRCWTSSAAADGEGVWS